MNYVECGSCGHYHREDYWGDCRNDDERFTMSELEDKGLVDWGGSNIIDLESQMEQERRGNKPTRLDYAKVKLNSVYKSKPDALYPKRGWYYNSDEYMGRNAIEAIEYLTRWGID